MKSMLVGAMLSAMLLCGAASAAPIVEFAPETSALNGNQADEGTGALTVSFSTPSPYRLSRLEWWGYYLSNDDPIDGFVVTLGGDQIAAQVVRSDNPVLVEGVDLFHYVMELDGLDLIVSGLQSISLVNYGDDAAEWYWQSVKDGPPVFLDPDTLELNPDWAPAWALYGEAVQSVPEPASVTLVIGALLAAGASARRRS
ncbi:MAG: hypothetical protein H6933_19650 [Burkholderiaceae bacterium]|nr:hypothetical protein [Xanthomonadales bacterium]MCP5287109.1 hypothetical protein [Burkholderiaceae bacterium]